MDTLTRMRAFVAVVDHEGFSAAARAQGRSKALLSKYVRELEDDLGVLLLNRTTRQFSLTDSGHTYYKRAVDLLREFEDLRDEVRDAREGLAGTIRVSAPRTMADVAIGQSLIDFAAKNPKITLDIDLDDRFADLVEEGFDLAIRITQMEDSGLIARKLAPMRLVLCATPAVLERYGTPTSVTDLSGKPFVVDTNSRRRNMLSMRDEEGQLTSIAIDGPVRVNSPLAVRMAALSDLGFIVAPDFIVAGDLHEGRLVEILPDAHAAQSGIYAVYPHRRYLPTRVRALVDYLANWFRETCPSSDAASLGRAP